MPKTFYITTPIYYPSDNLHLGHCYTTVAADALARYKRLQGFEVMFLTGTDEHGQKIEAKALSVGSTPKEYVDEIVASIQKLWAKLNISFDRFVRTTDDYHVQSVQAIFKKLYENGDIYKGNYTGKYCQPCETFLTDYQLVNGKCPDCNREVIDFSEEAYFFKLSKYQKQLQEFFNSAPDFISPPSRKNEMLKNFMELGLEDVCVSRTSISWGIPVDFNTKHTVYVWIDALSNYISALGFANDKYDDFEKFWPCDLHLVGKEIMRFHAIIWPAMLLSLGLPLPKKIFGHGWLLFDGDKMSKSKGNIVDPIKLCDLYGVDAIRYFLLREMPFGDDGLFSNSALITRINTNLANDLGNLVSRTTTMAFKYFDGLLPEEKAFEENTLREVCKAAIREMEQFMDDLNPPRALGEIWKVVNAANRYVDETAPWALAKDPTQNSKLAGVLYNLLEVLRVISVLITPIMPESAAKIQKQLNLPEHLCTWESAKIWGQTPSSNPLNKGDILFPRIEK
ncbi:methionine--tRNA ligase [Clostridia bacterium]|nr:methionine--tRNA ligase [Clostridia bacterium]